MSNSLILQTRYSKACLKVVFEKQQDRWSHRLVISDGESETTLLHSLEGDPDQPWPPSPPLQDASYHQLENGEAVLAVGMAGKSHWSASFSSDQAETILADLACLIKDNFAAGQVSVGSRYRVNPDVQIAFTDNGLELKLGIIRLVICPVTEPSSATRLACENEVLLLTPVELGIKKSRPTRWGYRLAWVHY